MTEAADDEIWGDWWLPGADELLHGRLTFDRSEGARLTVVGDFAALPPRAWSRPALFGESAQGTRLTLLEPFWLERPPPIEGASFSNVKTLVSAHVLLRGTHAASEEGFPIQRAAVRLRGLRELCLRPSIPRIGVIRGFVGDGEGEQPEQTVDVRGGRLTFVHRRYETRSEYRQTVEVDVEVDIAADAPSPLGEFWKRWLAPLQGLIIFAGRDPTCVESMVVIQPSTTEVHPAISRGSRVNWREERVEVLMPLPGLAADAKYGYRRALLPLTVLGDDAPAFIHRWWELHDTLGPATELLMSALGSRLFLENRLLNELSFAESYHRVLHDEPPITEEQHATYLEAMLTTVEDPAHQKHYRTRLRYAAAQGQRQRLKWLIRRARKALPELSGLKAKLADQLVDTRNALTHLDSTGASALTDEPLYRAIELLEITIQANLLMDLELTANDAGGLIRTSYINQTPFIPTNQGT
ncbi:MAG: HEPN domain-containing protein [Steroidobacteraceae bacterium]